jgi:hypothetical protein
MMAVLSSKQRKAMPKSEFAGPGKSYPVNDASHSANAKARASEMANKGKLSPAQEKAIDKKADAAIARISKPKPVR